MTIPSFSSSHQGSAASNNAVSSVDTSSDISVVAGDLLLAAVLLYEGGTTDTFSSVVLDPDGGSPESFSAVASSFVRVPISTAICVEFYTLKVAGTHTNVPARVTLSSNVHDAAIVVKKVADGDPDSPTGATAQTATGISTNPEDSITTTSANSLVVGLVGIQGLRNMTSTSPEVEQNEIQMDGPGGRDVTLDLVTVPAATTGTYTPSPDSDTTDDWCISVIEMVEGAAGGYTLTAEQGSFSLSGQAASLLAGRLLSAEAGAFSLAGFAAELRRGVSLTAEMGSYSLSGQDATLRADYRLAAEMGSYSLSGQAAELVGDFILAAEQGSYTFSGLAAGLTAGRLLSAEQGSYSLVGQDAEFSRELILDAEMGTYSLTGFAAGLDYSEAEPEPEAETIIKAGNPWLYPDRW